MILAPQPLLTPPRPGRPPRLPKCGQLVRWLHCCWSPYPLLPPISSHLFHRASIQLPLLSRSRSSLASPVSALVTIEISPPTNKPLPPPSGIRLNTTEDESSQSTDLLSFGRLRSQKPQLQVFESTHHRLPFDQPRPDVSGFLESLAPRVDSHSRPRSSPCTAETTSGFISRFAYPRLRILCKVVLIYQTFLKLLPPPFPLLSADRWIISAPNELLASAFTLVS